MLQTAGHQAQFWFATGGAGFCISRPLALKMAPVIRNDKLMTISDRIGFPDDVTIGFIIGEYFADEIPNNTSCRTIINLITFVSLINSEYLLKVPLTVIDEFHSHLEPLDQIPSQTFHKQVRWHQKTIKISFPAYLSFPCRKKLTIFIYVHSSDFLQLCVERRFQECH